MLCLDRREEHKRGKKTSWSIIPFFRLNPCHFPRDGIPNGTNNTVKRRSGHSRAYYRDSQSRERSTTDSDLHEEVRVRHERFGRGYVEEKIEVGGLDSASPLRSLMV